MARFAAPLVALVAATGAACSFGALDGFSGAPTEGDAGPGDAASAAPDTSSAGEAAAPLVSGASCKAIKEANPNAPDGRYRIVPVASEATAPFDADCDMTQDDGGWMRVTESMILEEKKQSVTVVHTTDERDQFMLRVYANSRGCGQGPQDGYLATVRDVPRWSRLRARYEFYGNTSCWNILGAMSDDVPFVTNIIPFEKTIDVARDALKMGGSLGDAFAGAPERCDDVDTNFWQQQAYFGRRSIVAIVRRGSADLPAGLATSTSCSDVAEGVTSPTYWEYRDIYVR